MRGRVRGGHGGQDTWRGHVQVQYSTVQCSTVHVAGTRAGSPWTRARVATTVTLTAARGGGGGTETQRCVSASSGGRAALDTNLRENYSFTITEAPNYAGIHPQYVDVKLR